MKHLHQLVGISKLQQLNYVTLCFNIWCEWLSTIFYVPLREFQTNESLYQWFSYKWHIRIEAVFFAENADYIDAGVEAPEAYQNLLKTIIERSECNIIGIYPKPLVDNIKKEHYKALQKHD